MRRMLAAALVLGLFGCNGEGIGTKGASSSDLKSGGNQVGSLRGYRAINQHVVATALAPGQGTSFDIGWLLDGERQVPGFFGGVEGFRALLGGFSSTGAHAGFQNGAPNGVNMLLWDLILGQLAHNLAGACTAQADELTFVSLNERMLVLRLDPGFMQTLKAGCNLDREALQGVWYALMGFEAPEDEFAAWYAYFVEGDAAAGQPAAERFAVMLKGLFLNPHFLLEA